MKWDWQRRSVCIGLREDVLARCERDEAHAESTIIGHKVYPQAFVVAMSKESNLDVWLDGHNLRVLVSEKANSQAKLQLAVRIGP